MMSLFDVDYTVIKKPSAWYFLQEAITEKIIGVAQIRGLLFDWLRYKTGFPNNDFIEETVKRLAGIEKAALERIAETAFTSRIRRNIYADAADLIQGKIAAGEQVFFATSSIDILIKPLERFFGLEESVASGLEFSGEKTTGRLIGGSLFGERKKIAVQKWLEQKKIDARNISFYTDSYTDIPLLKYCGRAIAVNPDFFLEREAKKRGWEILRFRETLGGG